MMQKSSPKLHRLSRRHVLLLEVLIAFALVILCAVPLIYPHVYMAKDQRNFLQQVELDQLAGLVYGDILERLYLNAIPWQDLLQSTPFPLDSHLLARVGWKKPLYYKGAYQFVEYNHKPKKQGEVYPRTVWLYDLIITFVPVEYANATQEVQTEHAIHYPYKVFLVRDLETGGTVEGVK